MNEMEFRERVVRTFEVLLLALRHSDHRENAIQTIHHLRLDHEADKRNIERTTG